jgi:hypothetical protein
MKQSQPQADESAPFSAKVRLLRDLPPRAYVTCFLSAEAIFVRVAGYMTKFVAI